MLTPVTAELVVVLAAGLSCAKPNTSQCPAGNESVVAFAGVPDVSDVVVVELDRISPILPALALSPAVVPLIPAVVDGVIRPEALTVVNDAAFAPPVTAPCTYAVVATFVVLSPADAVAAVAAPIAGALRLVMSVFAPLAAAPSAVRAPAAVVDPVPPLATVTVGRSVATSARKVGAPEAPDGEANTSPAETLGHVGMDVQLIIDDGIVVALIAIDENSSASAPVRGRFMVDISRCGKE
ncbi:hypothetical protein DF163_14255 [Burkholderia stagnalis]|nr:hypothetical protein DF163_14255 [Burkholderia stagnalis]RQY01135.1 hypothetical protein DF119_09075 [Burkholderia stagnalis]